MSRPFSQGKVVPREIEEEGARNEKVVVPTNSFPFVIQIVHVLCTILLRMFTCLIPSDLRLQIPCVAAAEVLLTLAQRLVCRSVFESTEYCETAGEPRLALTRERHAFAGHILCGGADAASMAE